MAVVLKITGLDLKTARFQLISIITHTGFTTRESELITQHPTRRRIAEIVMLISYVAFASLIGIAVSFANNASLLAALITLAVALLFFKFVVGNKLLLRKFDRLVELRLKKTVSSFSGKTLEEVLKLDGEFGVAEYVISSKCGIAGKTLIDSGLKEKYIQVLNIAKGDRFIRFPSSKELLNLGDKVLVYGKIESMKDVFL